MRSLLFISFLAFSVCVYSQRGLFSQSSRDGNAVYLDFVGATGSIMGICYDRVISVGNNHYWSFNTGLGYFPGLGSGLKPIIGVPLMLNWAAGVNSSHFEIGFGLCYSSGLIQEYSRSNSTGMEIHRSLDVIFGTLRFGYKFQPRRGGFFLRTGFTPLIKLADLSNDYPEFFFFPAMGVGMGWCF